MIGLLVDSASTYAGDIDWLFTLITLLVGFWFVLVEVIIFYFIFRFRRKEGVRAQYVTGEKKSEKKWINIPHLLVILCDVVLLVGAIVVWAKVKQTLPPEEEKIRVIGRQWAWVFVHPGPDGKLDTEDDISTVDELHVKVNTLYHFDLESKDVVHSFSVPVFRLKQDAVPGRVITGWFEATKTGQFDIQCAEICGIGHGIMVARLIIESPDDHEQWMAQHVDKEANALLVSNERRTLK